MTKHSDHVPAARVVRQGSVMVPEPRVSLRERVEGVIEPVGPALRSAATYVVGLWPIWAVAVLAIAVLWAAGMP
jgi:hypothetical protein